MNGVRAMAQQNVRQYTTEDEKDFLKGIWADRRKSKKKRIAILKRYKDRMRTRTNWGDINPERIRKFVDVLIESLKRSMSRNN